MKKTEEINEKQKIFCREYILDFNASRAAIAAGYGKSGARQQGQRLLTYTVIQEELKTLMEKKSRLLGEKWDLTEENIIADLKEIKERCMTAKPVTIRVDGEEIETGEWVFNPGGAIKATVKLGEHIGMFKKDKGNVEETIESLLDLANKGKDK